MKKKIHGITLLAALLPFTLSANEQPNVRTVTEQFQDWTVACVEQEKGGVCEARHAISAPEGGVMGQISFSSRSDLPDQLLFQVALPLLADLKRTVAVQAEGMEPHQFQYAFCSQAACFVAEPANPQIVADFKKGVGFTIHARNIQNGEMALKGSLLGFSAAINRLNKKSDAK
jgi:invasion protein IalB